MSNTLQRVRELAKREELVISDHGYDELAADGILVNEVMAGLADARVVEDYPDFPKGPCVLVLQQDESGAPIHVLWGIPKGRSAPAVLITAYRPDPQRWTADFLHRRNA
jgi:hypothetical protein